MKRTKLFSLLCLGALLVSTSCSKDDDEDNNYSDDEDIEDVVEIDEEDAKETTKYNFFGAELYSKQTFKYGKFEAKMKMAYASGCISSMFLYYNDSHEGGGKVWNEIDIEVIGKKSDGFQTNIISGTAESKVTTEEMISTGSKISDDFHTYTIEWTPDYVAWYFDGKEVRRNDSSNDSKKQVAALVEEQSLRFNLWSSKSEEWVGPLYQKNIPIEQEIDYIKVYDYDADTKKFTERWTDEFNSSTLDDKHWSTGNWQMENVRERPQNVVVEEGVLKLKLTKELK